MMINAVKRRIRDFEKAILHLDYITRNNYANFGFKERETKLKAAEKRYNRNYQALLDLFTP